MNPFCHSFFEKCVGTLDKYKKRGMIQIIEQLLNCSESEEKNGTLTGMRL